MIEYYKNLSLENLFYVDENGDTQEEEWKSVPNYEKSYQCSNLGRLKSLERYVKGKMGARIQKEKILKQNIGKNGYILFYPHKDGISEYLSLHVLVASMFLNFVPCGNKKIVDHKINKRRFDNSIFNLQIITIRKNNLKDKTNKTGYAGVSYDAKTKKFRAKIVVNYVCRDLGIYSTAKEAGEKFKEAFELLEKGEDISHMIKVLKPAKTGYKNIYSNWNKFKFEFKFNGKSYAQYGFESPELANEALIEFKLKNNFS
jgi:hypothetical protein